jgi:hypothetical protein
LGVANRLASAAIGCDFNVVFVAASAAANGTSIDAPTTCVDARIAVAMLAIVEVECLTHLIDLSNAKARRLAGHRVCKHAQSIKRADG